jgi:hypothetical protein
MASGGIQSILALEVEVAQRAADRAVGDTPLDPRHEPCQPALGAPRIHGGLLKLGVDIGQTSVAKYMTRRRGTPSQGWKTFIKSNSGSPKVDISEIK